MSWLYRPPGRIATCVGINALSETTGAGSSCMVVPVSAHRGYVAPLSYRVMSVDLAYICGWKLYITSLVMIITAGLFVIARCSTPLKMFFIAQTPYKVTVCLNKVAAILLYLRLFPTKNFRVACYVVMGIIVSWSIGGVGATIWQCVPIEGAWNKAIDAKCIDSNKFWIAYAVMNILTDIMVLTLPIGSIMRLQMNIRERLMLCGVFLLGGFVTIASILRTTSVQNSLKNKEDITYNFIERGMWTLIEANLGIISACLPVLRRPLGKLFPRVFGSTKKSSNYFSGPGDHSKGYNLSNMSASAHPSFWRGTTRTHQVVSVSGPETTTGRKSDERRIIESLKGSDAESDPDSHGSRGIAKRVDVVRTSFHEADRE
ncbi:hypothetical protein LCI18_003063 [Fusarium solani-melongenae]|uniref:Uncharacterized protein n=1 Tax=Fusarium solani subsp. cucurbitae TaxID=2747967 RepID=A0ACD3YTF4_FUSSC|nr:hypothetical protein LCI18_003063 [Fusarium solani-melongenae]